MCSPLRSAVAVERGNFRRKKEGGESYRLRPFETVRYEASGGIMFSSVISWVQQSDVCAVKLLHYSLKKQLTTE